MSAENTIRALLAGVQTTEPEEWRRKAARVAWVKQTVAALRAAHRKVDQAWDRIFDSLPDNLSDEELDAMEIPSPPEQAEVDALHAQLRAVIDHDRWPKELYFGRI